MRVLIVEDDTDVRDSLEDFFVNHGLQVDTAINGAEALSSD